MENMIAEVFEVQCCQDCGMNEFGKESFGMWEASPSCSHFSIWCNLGMLDRCWRPKGTILVWEDEET